MRHYHLLFIISLLFAAFLSPSHSQTYPHSPPPFAPDNDCLSEKFFSCGPHISDLRFPFWEDSTPNTCLTQHPGFNLTCVAGDYAVIRIEGVEFRVLHVDQALLTMNLTRNDLFLNPCSVPEIRATKMNPSYFAYNLSRVASLNLLYACSNADGDDVPSFTCSGDDDHHRVVYANETRLRSVSRQAGECREGTVGALVSRENLRRIEVGELEVIEGLQLGFEVKYMDLIKCSIRCKTTKNVHPHCRFDSHSEFQCADSGEGKNVKLKIGIASAGAVFGAMIVIVFVLVYCVRRKRVEKSSSTLLSRSSEISSSMDDAEKGGSIHGSIRVFSYEELVEATNNFDSTKELGDGGFGTVYHGKLKDGRSVAVKRLYENNYRRVEQFVNEAKILASVRHENLVSLYGCTSRHCRELLLVYEYVPNGTVADHLHGPRARPGGLTWPARLSIAIDTAAALTYLHRSEIVHRDVKTTNILLDSHFRVKVADFGLSRLFPTEATHVSTAPQGTPGYVDPDYHLCYQLTSKSDVFSFGVVLVELISSMPAVDITRHRHDINLSTMALNRIQNHALHELVDSSLGFKEDPRAQRSITAVAELAFRCLQQEKDMRPSMDDVWEELNANHEREYVPAAETVAVSVPAAASGDDAGAVLLKNGPLTLSPDSLTLSWGSGRSTTPKSSS